MLSTSCNRALFIGIAVDSLKAHRRAWGAVYGLRKQAKFTQEGENTRVRTKTRYRSADH